MNRSRDYLVSIRALRYVSKYLGRIDFSPFHSISRKGLKDLVQELDDIISFEESDLSF